MNRRRKFPLFVAALSAVLAAAVVTGPGVEKPFCVGMIETGQSSCFASEPELVAFQEAAAAPTLVTFYRDPGGKGATGYKNFASAYNRSWCTATEWFPSESSDGDLRNDFYSNGGALGGSISSFRVAPGSYCVVRLWSAPGFAGAYLEGPVGGDCLDLRTCTGQGNWDNRTYSFQLS